MNDSTFGWSARLFSTWFRPFWDVMCINYFIVSIFCSFVGESFWSIQLSNYRSGTRLFLILGVAQTWHQLPKKQGDSDCFLKRFRMIWEVNYSFWMATHGWWLSTYYSFISYMCFWCFVWIGTLSFCRNHQNKGGILTCFKFNSEFGMFAFYSTCFDGKTFNLSFSVSSTCCQDTSWATPASAPSLPWSWPSFVSAQSAWMPWCTWPS